MFHLHSLSSRIPLAIVGGILYGSLVHRILTVLDGPPEFSLFSGVFLFLFYVGSRLLILLSGVNSAYYSRTRETGGKHIYENTFFFHTTQWVGKFYHYHDIALFLLLLAVCFLFLSALSVDWFEGEPLGNTFLKLAVSLFP